MSETSAVAGFGARIPEVLLTSAEPSVIRFIVGGGLVSPKHDERFNRCQVPLGDSCTKATYQDLPHDRQEVCYTPRVSKPGFFSWIRGLNMNGTENWERPPLLSWTARS